MALKVQQRAESIRLGRRLLDRTLANANTSINDLDFRRLRKVFKEFNVRKLDDLLADIGIGNLMAYVVAQRLLALENPAYQAVDIHEGGPVAIKDGEGLVINYGRCCGPVPGDPVVGHMTPGKGFVVHLEACNNVTEVRRRAPQDIIPARWSETQREFETTLRLTVKRRKGVLAELATSVNTVDAGINHIRVDERSSDLSTVVVEISVRDHDHLKRAMQRLRNITPVQSVERAVS
ncbi:MAG TPA: bifunctional (p)ppGpp synthetase/guanosine-3',5'-bis(diphosphate) 3'-pyrophosphohydrolase [Pseudomonadales bacterium]|nr:bifunctional (p)ppGpp synthetase/guanosine-3',5'-bis(diphosphate) 3'-pyrophosphohydrolase [Pseudomonadales bacterium]